MARKRVAVLISGRGSNMAALIAAARAPEFPAEVALVLSNRPDADGLALAREANIPTAIVDHRPYGKDRAGFDAAVMRELDSHRIDLVCLGGFMRLFASEFVQTWHGRMLNIHPSLLPAFPGLDTHARALAAGSGAQTPKVAIAIAPHLVARMTTLERPVPLADTWKTARILLPPPLAALTYTDVFTGAELKPAKHNDSAWLFVGQALRVLPVALLTSLSTPNYTTPNSQSTPNSATTNSQ